MYVKVNKCGYGCRQTRSTSKLGTGKLSSIVPMGPLGTNVNVWKGWVFYLTHSLRCSCTTVSWGILFWLVLYFGKTS